MCVCVCVFAPHVSLVWLIVCVVLSVFDIVVLSVFDIVVLSVFDTMSMVVCTQA